MDVTIYGKPSSTYEYMKMLIRDNAERAGIHLSLKEVQDTQKFVDNKIDKIPAIMIGDNLLYRDSEDLNAYIARANRMIMENENFGDLKRIIVPIDFSASSENAISYAYRFSKHMKSVLNLLNVDRPKYEDYIEIDLLKPKARMSRLESYASELTKQSISQVSNSTIVKSEVVPGFPAEEILAKTKENSNSIVIMGSHGSSGAIDRLLGSVSTSVAKGSDVPVLLVPDDVHFTSLHKILYCSLDIEVDSFIIEELTSLAKCFDAEIHIVHIHSKQDDVAYMMNNIYKKWKQNYPKNKLVTKVIYNENVAEAITNYTSENDIKLISLCRSEKRLYKNIFKTGLMDQLVSDLSIPLLVLSK